jgi:ABC-type branched-subunit amino acid transport system ATPase component
MPSTEAFVFNNSSLTPLSGNLIPDPTLAGRDLGILSDRAEVRARFGFLTLAVLLLVAVGVANMARGSMGRRFLAVRSNERAAAACGVSPASAKLLAFGLSAFIAGIAGAMLGYSRGQLSAASFDAFSGLELLVFAYLGGITSVTGALVAGLIAPLGLLYVVLNRVVDLGGYYLLLGGLGVIAATIFNPEGIDGAVRRNLAALQTAVTRRGSSAKALETLPERSTETSGLSAATPPRVPDRPEPETAALLEVNRLSVSYGAMRAVDDVTLLIDHGTIVGLIGPNGAGKTTLVDALTGFVPYEGHVRFAGEPLDGRPHERCGLGLARTWQSLELFGDLTVRENLLVAADRLTPGSFLLDLVRPTRAGRWDEVSWAIELVGLEHLAGRRPGTLSLGQQKLVVVARALATGATLMLLDEPATGLDPSESRVLGERLETLTEHGISVLVIEHDVDLVLRVCDHVFVLDFGKVVAEGTPSEIKRHEHVVTAHLGRHAVATEPAEAGASPLQGSTS